MEEIVKHINDTNASYRSIGAGDAKNTDLFLDNNHYELFRDAGEQITVRYNKENLQKAILFIASILPRKYDNSSIHRTEPFSSAFVFDQLALLDVFFTIDGNKVEYRTQTWNLRKDIMKKNGEIDNRFYFNGLLEEVSYINDKGEHKTAKFTIRNYLAGGFSDLHIKKADNGIFDVWVTNTIEYKDDGKERQYEEIDTSSNSESLQRIFYGAPGTGKSNTIKREVDDQDKKNFRVTFHPDSDYSTFVGTYKPTMKSSEKVYSLEELVAKLKETKLSGISYPCHKFSAQYWKSIKKLTPGQIKQLLLACDFTESMNVEVTKGVAVGEELSNKTKEEQIVYSFVPQAFTKAYTAAWNTTDDVYLIIEEINRGNCAQIFGDLFQLLDRDANGYSEYPVDADSDLGDYIRKELSNSTRDDFPEGVKEGRKLVLSNNLYIWATMNTSDQSLFPIDSAFKRRWDWKYMKIKDEGKDWKIDVELNVKDADGNPTTKKLGWWPFIEKINDIIASMTSSADKQLGYFFCKATENEEGKSEPTIITKDTFVSKVIFYLWNDVFKDYGFEDASLFQYKETIGGNEETRDLTFPDFYDKDGEHVNTERLKGFLESVMNWQKNKEEQR